MIQKSLSTVNSLMISIIPFVEVAAPPPPSPWVYIEEWNLLGRIMY